MAEWRRRSSRPVTASNPTQRLEVLRQEERKAFSASAFKQPGSILRKDHRLSRYSRK